MIQTLLAFVVLLTACQHTREVVARAKQDGTTIDAEQADADEEASADGDADMDADTNGDPDSDRGADMDLDEEVDAETDGEVLSSEVGMTAGGYHTCFWHDGDAWCWGANNGGQLGDGTRDESTRPVRVAILSDVVGMTASDRIVLSSSGHSCAWNNDGEGWCWGANGNGQLGDGTTRDSLVPVPLDLPSIAGISAGTGHTCAWTLDGSAWCWGLGDEGQLGIGVVDVRLVPTEVPSIADIRSMSAGMATTCAVEGSGTVLCWGLRLGMSGTENPTIVTGPEDAIDVTVGEGHACVIERDGALLCWGWNSRGQIGIGTTVTATYPIEVDLPPIANASAGGELTCATSASGSVSCWGFWVGDPLGEIHTTPFSVPDLPVIEGVTVGYEHGCAYTLEGEVYCWGGNTYGAVGNGAHYGVLSPERVEF